MNRIIILTVVSLFFAFSAFSLAAQKTYHVNIQKGNDSNNGLTWSAAFKNIQSAIDIAEAGDNILIAEGTYHPTKKIAEIYGGQPDPDKLTGDRHRTFFIQENVKIYGGFPANATNTTTMSSRNWQLYQTILSGDFNNNDGEQFENMQENAFHVIVLLNASPLLDGLYITGGYANDVSSLYPDEGRTYITGSDGGGIHAYSPITESSPILNDVTFFGNFAGTAGGAMYNYSPTREVSPKMTNVSFIHNKAETGHGGALYSRGDQDTYAELSNVQAIGNESQKSGGGLYFIAGHQCAPKIINTVVSGNYSRGGNGGGIFIGTYYGDAQPEIINATICGNKVGDAYGFDGGGLVIFPYGLCKANIFNTVIWGNQGTQFDNFYAEGTLGSQNTIAASLIEGYDAPGLANLPGNTNPLFLSPVSPNFAPTTNGDYQLTLASPLINKGINEHVTLPVDILHHQRIFGNIVDIAAYESQGTPPVDNDILPEAKSVWANNGSLYVRINHPSTLRVYSPNGLLIKHIRLLDEGMYTYPLPKGIYIVTINNKPSEKIIIH